MEKLVLFAYWSRFDPRIGEIWVSYVSTRWQSLSPLELRSAALDSGWAACIGVLLAFTERAIFSSKIPKTELLLFKSWKRLVTVGLPLANNELFFLGLNPIGGDSMAHEAEFPSKEYASWGYLSDENLAAKRSTTTLSKEARIQRLKALLKEKRIIRATDYWNAINRCVTPRQAERDLGNSNLVRKTGNTKGAFYMARR